MHVWDDHVTAGGTLSTCKVLSLHQTASASPWSARRSQPCVNMSMTSATVCEEKHPCASRDTVRSCDKVSSCCWWSRQLGDANEQQNPDTTSKRCISHASAILRVLKLQASTHMHIPERIVANVTRCQLCHVHTSPQRVTSIRVLVCNKRAHHIPSAVQAFV
jgi:hypothetical protein